MAYAFVQSKTPTKMVNVSLAQMPCTIGVDLPQASLENTVSDHSDRSIGLHWLIDVEEIARYIELPFARTPKLRSVMAVIVADAIWSARHHPEQRIHYSRRKGWWQEEAAKHFGPDYTYTTVVAAVDALLAAGILIDHDLRPPSPSTGVQSSYRPSPWLASIKLLNFRRDTGELIRLKDKAKVLMNYRDTERTSRERAFIQKINRLYENTEITLISPNAVVDGDLIHFAEHTVDKTKRSLYRVYNNGSWSAGGRFYGPWWQSCPSAERCHILINGERTKELDFPQLHPRLLYAYAGQELEGDAYSIPGQERKVCKRAFNTLLNAADLPEAEGALLEHVGGCRKTARKLIVDIKARHPAVSQHFHTGIGLWFQNVDAGICRKILYEMCIKKGIVVLPVHDSFIVPHWALDDLNKVRWSAFDHAILTVANK